MKLGSLFDGAGTAPLAATICGIEPVWASEIEPYPIKVTKARFPAMKHLGDIAKIDGAAIEPVDIICGGSPCQDLSVAGARAGLKDGERSHLFYEMARIIREMKEATNGEYPRYVVWENVPGAFSSNKGYDFLSVLQAFAEIRDPIVHVPRPPCKRNTDRLDWKRAGTIMGDGFSIAWRTVDAQYWGVPQRRRRIYLVADFGGHRAAEILFEREGVRGYFETGRTPWQGTAADAQDGTRADDRKIVCFEPRSIKEENWIEQTTKNALRAEASKSSHVIVEELRQAFSLQGNTIDRNAKQNGMGVSENTAHTLNATDRHAVAFAMQGFGDYKLSDVSGGLKARDYKDATDLICGVDCRNMNESIEVYPTLQAKSNGGISLNFSHAVRISCIVRRLTPLECCRLQGFPDWWEDGVPGSDAARYKMWGNGMALPNMLHVMRGIKRVEETNENQDH